MEVLFVSSFVFYKLFVILTLALVVIADKKCSEKVRYIIRVIRFVDVTNHNRHTLRLMKYIYMLYFYVSLGKQA